MKIPLSQSDLSRAFASRPQILTWNAFYEEDPTNQTDGVAMIRRPAVRQLLEVGPGPIRAIYYRRDLFDNNFFVVSGDEFYRVARTGPTDFDTTQITGTIDDTYTPSIVASGDNVFITDQVTLQYTDGTGALATVATPDDVAIYKLLYIGGYVICIVKDSQRWYYIEPGETTIDALSYFEAEAGPDWIVDAEVLGDQIYLFGGSTVEAWFLSGDVTAPFQRIQGRLMETGIFKGTACAIANTDTLFVLGIDGTARVGASLQKISNPGVEERIRRAIASFNLSNL